MHAAEKPLETVTFDAVSNLAREDMEAVDRLISKSLESDVALVSQVSRYIVASGGKRLRPLVVLLAARAFDYEGEQHVRAAAVGAGDAIPRTPCSAIRPACWSAISCTRAHSR